MTTKKERARAEALENIREALKSCGPDGSSTLLIIDDGGRPSPTGRTHYLEIHVLSCQHAGGTNGEWECRPRTTYYLTINAANLLGYRLNKADQIVMGGYGYSRSLHLASNLAHAAGHPIYCDTIGGGLGGARGWIRP